MLSGASTFSESKKTKSEKELYLFQWLRLKWHTTQNCWHRDLHCPQFPSKQKNPEFIPLSIGLGAKTYSPNLTGAWKRFRGISGAFVLQAQGRPQTVIMGQERAKKTKEKSLQPLYVSVPHSPQLCGQKYQLHLTFHRSSLLTEALLIV